MSLGVEEEHPAAVAGDALDLVHRADDPAWMARGDALEAAGREAGAYIEGLSIARRVSRYAAHAGVDAPIAGVLADVLEGTLTTQGGLERLMLR